MVGGVKIQPVIRFYSITVCLPCQAFPFFACALYIKAKKFSLFFKIELTNFPTYIIL